MAETFVERQEREMQEQLRLHVANQLDYDPDRAIRVLKAQGQTGLPADIIDAGLDDIEKQIRIKNFNADAYKETPKFAKFAAENPYHLSVLKRDQQHLNWLERTIKQIDLGVDASWAQNEAMRIGARRAAGDFQEGDTERLKELKKYQVEHTFGATNPMVKLIVWGAKQIAPTLYTGKTGITYALGGASIGAAAGALAGPGAPITIPVAATIGAGVAGITGMFKASEELMRGEAYNQYIDMGFEHDKAATMAKIVGPIAGAMEAFGIGVTLKYSPGVGKVTGAMITNAVSNMVAKPAFSKAAGVLVVRYGEVLGSEVITEIGQESTTIVGGEILKRTEGIGTPMTWDEYWDTVADVAVETMKGAALITSVGPLMRFAGDSHRAYQGRRMKYLTDDLHSAVKGSKTKADIPEKYKEFVERLADKKSLFIDVDRFTEYFQEIGEDPDQIAKSLGIDLESASVSGTDLEIPMSAYIDQIADTEHHEALAQDLKAHEDQWSVREAEQWYENASEIEKALADEVVPEGHAPIAEIYETMIGDLLAAGIEHSAAEKYATFQEYVFATLAERNNMDPLVLFNRYWGGIRREIPGVQQKTDIDVFVDPLLDRLRTGDVPTQRDIFGESLTDFLKAKGGLTDVGGELAARDVQKEIKGLVKAAGISIDAAAEVAAEAGFIAEADEGLLLAALDRELRGEPVFGRGADEQIADLAKALDDLSTFLEAEGIDLETMSNAEIRQRLEGDRTLDQSKIDELLELAIMSAVHDDTLLTRALLLLPDVAEVQDFGELTFADTVAVEGLQEDVVIEQYTQKVFDQAMKRRNDLQTLLDCVRG